MCLLVKNREKESINLSHNSDICGLYNLIVDIVPHSEWRPIALAYVLCKSQIMFIFKLDSDGVGLEKKRLYTYIYNFISCEHINAILNDCEIDVFNDVSLKYNNIVSNPYTPYGTKTEHLNQTYLSQLKRALSVDDDEELAEEDGVVIDKIDDLSIDYISKHFDSAYKAIIDSSGIYKAQYRSFKKI